VYFDLAENTQAVNLGLSCTAKFVSTCTITGNSFSNSIAVPTFTGKPDNDLLTYPSINSNQVNYYPETLVLPCPNQNTIVGFYLDNIYNQSAMQSPIVTTFDLPANVVAQSLFFSGPIPDQISVRNCSTGLYQVLTYGTTGSVIIPDGTSIDNIKMTYNQLPIIRSMVSLTFQTAVLPRSCSGSVSSIAYSLLKDNQVYLTEAVVYVSPPGQGNSLSINYSTNIYSPGQPDIMPVFIQTVVWNTMKHDDYLLYTLDENMDFSDPSNQNNLLFSFNPGTNYQTLAAFNAQYFSSNPMIVQISGRTLKIQNISIPGYISDCNLQNFSLFFRVVTKVADKPTKIDNVNTLALRDKNDVLLPLTSIAPYTWHVQSTQKINPDVFFSCNDGLTKNSGITIKKDDEVNVYYTLENTNLLKYDQKAVVMYGSLITSVAKPSIQLIKTDGTTHVASVIDPSLYTVTYAGGSPGNYSTLLYGNTFNVNSTNIFQISIPLITINAYDKIEAALTYSSGLGLSSNSEVFINAIVGSFPINSVNRSLTIGPKSDCDLFNCTECITSFSPTAGEEYVLSAWVKESFTGNPPTTYANSGVRVTFNDGAINTLALFRPTGPIVDGWQRIEVSFVVPVGANNIHITLVNESPNTDVFFDDIRIHPYNSNMKSFVYDPSTQKLVAELDENNFATLYEYDDEGILIRVKKETERGV
ncbi:MAG TPA: hypothetical protein VK796_09125, partial [Cytophaga sp.]|nr:hypothetical protein [Cytophaga sp.]